MNDSAYELPGGIIKCEFVPKEVFKAPRDYEKPKTARIQLENLLLLTFPQLPDEYQTLTKKSSANGKRSPQLRYANFELWSEPQEHKMIAASAGRILTHIPEESSLISVPKIMVLFDYSKPETARHALKAYHENFLYATTQEFIPLIEERARDMELITAGDETIGRFFKKVETFCIGELGAFKGSWPTG